ALVAALARIGAESAHFGQNALAEAVEGDWPKLAEQPPVRFSDLTPHRRSSSQAEHLASQARRSNGDGPSSHAPTRFADRERASAAGRPPSSHSCPVRTRPFRCRWRQTCPGRPPSGWGAPCWRRARRRGGRTLLCYSAFGCWPCVSSREYPAA